MKKILIIDDSKPFVKGISEILRDRGFITFESFNGLEGIEKAKEIVPDLILCDIVMPKLDGYEVLKAIRNNDKLSTIPFIFISAFSDNESQRIGIEQGADDFIHKSEISYRLDSSIKTQFDKHNRILRQVFNRMKIVSKNITYALPHEFRTALNETGNLANYLKKMADRISIDEIKEIADDMIESNKRLMTITENFLFYAKLQEFHDNPELSKSLRKFITEEPLSIIQSIGEVACQRYDRMNDFYIESGNDHISLQISSEYFYKLMFELIDNAFKFSDKGTKVKVRHWLDPDCFYFEISDNGRGMSEKQLAYIGVLSQFDRELYEQQGAGLGLAIAKSTVEVHGGTFKILSKINKGTDIILRLYIKKNKPL